MLICARDRRVAFERRGCVALSTSSITWKEGERLKVQLIVHGSILEIFVSDTTSLTGRIYRTPSGWLGLYAANGEVEFQNVRVAPLRPLD